MISSLRGKAFYIFWAHAHILAPKNPTPTMYPGRNPVWWPEADFITTFCLMLCSLFPQFFVNSLSQCFTSFFEGVGELLPSFESLEGKDCYFPIFASSKMHCLAAEFFGKADFILRPQIFGAISSISRMKSKLARAGFPLIQGEHVSAHSKRWPQNVTTLWKRFGKSFCYSRVVPVFF